MRLRQLGNSDLHVSEISLGSWLTYGGGVADDQARSCVDAAFDAGINFIDTANVYALGAAESFLGDVLESRPRGDPGCFRAAHGRRLGEHRPELAAAGTAAEPAPGRRPALGAHVLEGRRFRHGEDGTHWSRRQLCRLWNDLSP